jgi:hypothetical protein
MSKDYVVRLYFSNGSSEQVKYDREEQAVEAYDEVVAAVDSNTKRGELTLPDGTRFGFRVDGLSHWKYFKYTPSTDRENGGK